jgi:Flp pilus assembly protein TadG
MITSFVSKSRRRRGSVLVEFAVMFPLMVLMALGTADFARVFYAGIAVASAAHAGVQYGSVSAGNAGDWTGMQQAAIDDAANQGLTGVTAVAVNFCGCNGSSTAVSCNDQGTCPGAGPKDAPNGYVRVTVSYTYNTLVNYPGIPSSMALVRSATMRAQ